MKNVSETHHTPGPWRITDKGEASPNTSWISGAHGHKVCTVESYPFLTTGKADANLIASAPALVVAINRLLRCPDLNLDTLEPETRAAIEQACKTLEKAGFTA